LFFLGLLTMQSTSFYLTIMFYVIN
jgi:hypothetical protein